MGDVRLRSATDRDGAIMTVPVMIMPGPPNEYMLIPFDALATKALFREPHLRRSLYRAVRAKCMGPQRKYIIVIAVEFGREPRWGTICRAEVIYDDDGHHALLGATPTGDGRSVTWAVWAD